MDQNKIQRLQFLEQNLQSVLAQKKAFAMEFSENESAMEAVSTSNDKIYKIIGQLMIVQNRDKAIEELENKKKLIQTRIDMLGKQEELIEKEIVKIREEIIPKKSNNSK